jgi:predicted XRE-type DNA-binding protein
MNKEIILTEKDKQRFYRKVKFGSSDDCWEWNAYTYRGYGRLFVNKKSTLAHRISYIIFYGKQILDDMQVCHKCDNRKCVNPNHLFIGTNQDNALDMEQKGRGRHPKWSNHWNAKITEKDVIDIRNLYHNEKITLKKIANIYKLNWGSVSQIVSGKCWHGIGGEINKEKYKNIAKLKPENVIEIKKLIDDGILQKNIAKIFGISPTAISAIHMGKTWKEVI